jgi:putative ABC transport system substrate-binding protein
VRRRDFLKGIAGSAAAWPLAARAQPRMRRIAWLGLGRADAPSPYVDALRAGLRDWGWIEGRNLTLALYWATGREDMETAARELLASDPDVIVTPGAHGVRDALAQAHNARGVRLQRRSG